MKRFLFSLLCMIFPWVVSAQSTPTIDLDSLRSDPKKLLRVLYDFPKGGDLHNHLEGATYPENLLTYAMHENVCISLSHYTAYYADHCPQNTSILSILRNKSLKNQVIESWSFKDFKNETESGHDHFFKSFPKFMPLIFRHRPEIINEIVLRAVKQHVLYLELMVIADNMQSLALAEKIPYTNNYVALRNALEKKGIENVITTASKNINSWHHAIKHTGPIVRYQFIVLREFSPSQIFAQLLTGFELAKRNPLVVGVNIVMPEDGKIATRDYTLHMKMINYFHQHYPLVKLSLHAGEVTSAWVKNRDLTFHITEAIHLGHANRIGHGVSIRDEKNYSQTLRDMANSHIPVEINLTSNDLILNQRGASHPLSLYLNSHVPVCLSTDDEGISRSDLTHEYFRAVMEHHLDYATLKMISRNSATYSFLPGESLWKNTKSPHTYAAVSTACKALLKRSPKAELECKLETAFAQFEHRYAP